MEKLQPDWNQFLHYDGIPSSLLIRGAHSWVIRLADGQLIPSILQWGFKREKTRSGFTPALAKVEKAPTHYPFGESWMLRRCLVPADGWYEWKVEEKEKQSYCFTRSDCQPILLAALWSGNTYALLTANADGNLNFVDSRKPIALAPENALKWLKKDYVTGHDLSDASLKAEAFHFSFIDLKLKGNLPEGQSSSP